VQGEGEHIGPAGDKLWCDTQRLEGRDASTGPQPVAQRSAGDTAAQSKSCRDELGAPEVVGANKKASLKHPKGNKGCSSVKVKVTWPTAQMKCLCKNTHSMGNKQEELEATALLESYDLFRKDRQGKRGGGVALYIKKSIQPSLKNSHEKVESLWVRIRDRGNKGNLVIGVYSRTLDQGEHTDKAFFLQLQEA